MLRKILYSKYFILFVGFLLGIVTITSVQYVSAHGGNIDFIHGCIRPVTGLLRIIGANDTCGQNETPLDWSKGSEPGTEFPLLCPSCDLSAANSFNEGGDRLTGRNLTNAFLRDARLNGINLSQVNLTNSNVSLALFNDTQASNANFQSSFAEGANFNNANLNAANFTSAMLYQSNFDNANLQNANFTNADLQSATNMSTANRTGIVWNNTTCPDGTNSDINGNTCEGHL